VIIPPLDGKTIMEIMTKGYQGGFTSDERVIYQSIDTLTLIINETDDRWRRVCLDGSVEVVDDSITISKESRNMYYITEQ